MTYYVRPDPELKVRLWRDEEGYLTRTLKGSDHGFESVPFVFSSIPFLMFLDVLERKCGELSRKTKMKTF